MIGVSPVKKWMSAKGFGGSLEVWRYSEVGIHTDNNYVVMYVTKSDVTQ